MLEGLRLALLAERGTNPTEFHYSRLRLEEAGATVVVVGNHELEYALEDHSRACADVKVSQVAGQPFDGVVIPGGIGPEKLRQNLQELDLARDAYDRGKVTASGKHKELMEGSELYAEIYHSQLLEDTEFDDAPRGPEERMPAMPERMSQRLRRAGHGPHPPGQGGPPRPPGRGPAARRPKEDD